MYKGSDIKILLPQVKEEGLDIVPNSSTSIQLAIGDALAIAALKKKQFSKFDFSKFHPGGNIGKQLKTVNEIMSTGNQIPFVNEDQKMKFALQIITQKKLGVLIAKNKKNLTTGIITDGNIRKLRQNGYDFQNTTVKKVMKKKPFTIDSNTLAVKAHQIMNEKKITSLCVHRDNKPKKTIGLLHIHHILSSNLG